MVRKRSCQAAALRVARAYEAMEEPIGLINRTAAARLIVIAALHNSARSSLYTAAALIQYSSAVVLMVFIADEASNTTVQGTALTLAGPPIAEC